MKFQELRRLLERNGFYIVRANKHWVFSNGIKSIPVPRQKEINYMLAKQIVKQMEGKYETR